MNPNEMYMDTYGRLDGYRVGGLRVMLVGVVVVVMFAGSIIASVVGQLLPALGVMLAELVAVAELAAPLFLQWLLIRKAHELWDALREQAGLRIPDAGKGLLRALTLFYASVIAITLLVALALWILVLTNRNLTFDQVPTFMFVIGGGGLVISGLSWFVVLPLYLWRKLTVNTKLICRQIGCHYEDLMHDEGRWLLFGGGLIGLIFWTFLIAFQPLRLMFRAMKYHDALIDLLETNTELIAKES